ncbi:hypothetical protein VIGAN_06004400 [Vigna angularis var. angularis]|uniref:Secreted protein n=1 Tax=Vigna angularis var. angularis TaxID=157739 RepID=A0A0S3S8P9_PHAAN|nr:hypothetical protein VIGAN_06004400 [Vigna angularis var. angularis]
MRHLTLPLWHKHEVCVCVCLLTSVAATTTGGHNVCPFDRIGETPHLFTPGSSALFPAIPTLLWPRPSTLWLFRLDFTAAS